MGSFEDWLAREAEIEGWFGRPAAAVWDALLAYQREVPVRGDLLEIGVWKGKSALLAALHARTHGGVAGDGRQAPARRGARVDRAGEARGRPLRARELGRPAGQADHRRRAARRALHPRRRRAHGLGAPRRPRALQSAAERRRPAGARRLS